MAMRCLNLIQLCFFSTVPEFLQPLSHPSLPASQQLWYGCNMGDIGNNFPEVFARKDTHTLEQYNTIFMQLRHLQLSNKRPSYTVDTAKNSMQKLNAQFWDDALSQNKDIKQQQTKRNNSFWSQVVCRIALNVSTNSR